MYKKVPGIPEPSLDPRSLQNTAIALKEAVELMSGQRGGPMYPTWDDLIRLGLAKPEDVPR